MPLIYRTLTLATSVSARYGAKVKAGVLLRDARQETALRRLEKVHDRLRLMQGSREGDSRWIKSQNTIASKVLAAEPAVTNASTVDEYLNRITIENRQLMREKGVKMFLTKAEREGKFVVPKPSRHSGGTAKLPFTHEPPTTSSLDTKLAGYETENPTKLKRNSLYLFGSVGRGKTMLMDTFYTAILHDATLTLRHKREHFFDFMREIHKRMRDVDRQKSPELTPVEVVANSIADEIDLICLDEVSVVDVQDASILPRVLEILSLRGVTLIMTSNMKPNELYAGGLNRHIFIPPLLRALEQTCVVVNLDEQDAAEQVDHRKNTATRGKWADSRYYCPGSSPVVATEFDEDFQLIEGICHEGPWIFNLPHSPTRTLRGGKYKLDKDHLSGVMFNFDSLCGREHGEADFSVLASHFQLHGTVFFIRDVPVFGELDGLGCARRFGKLVEILYDKAIPVRILASDTPEEIFALLSNSHDAVEQLVGDKIPIGVRGAVREASTRALDRCVSRLLELARFG